MKKNSKNSLQQTHRLMASLILAILFSITLIQPVNSKDVKITFGETKAENDFPNGVRFSVKINVNDQRGIIEFHYRAGGDLWSYASANCSAKSNNNLVEYYSCVYYLNTEGFPPQLPITYKWRLLGTADRYSQENILIYENPEFSWNHLDIQHLTIWWHDRPSEFAQQVLSTAQSAIQQQEVFYGMQLEDPIQIVVLNSQDELFVWREETSRSIGGEAFPWFGTTIQIVELDMSENNLEHWLNEVVPHEISHLYFFQATSRQYSDPPNWLNEGMAGYNEISDHREDWYFVHQAIRQNKLIPLSELRSEFPENDEEVRLAYAESTTAIIYIIETYGQDGLKKLFSAYQAGEDSDTAFMQAFGRNLDEFEKDWQAWVVTQRGTSTNELFIVLFTFICLSVACSCSLVVLVIFLIVLFNKKIKIQPVE